MSFAQALQDIIRDRKNILECANRCARAYAVSNGYEYTPFGEDAAEAVAQNYAGLQAVVSGLGLICSLGSASTIEISGKELLARIAGGTCNEDTRNILLRLANATWGAGQPFRSDKGPLGRADRVNVFELLPQEETAKDWVQIQAAARFLEEKLWQHLEVAA